MNMDEEKPAGGGASIVAEDVLSRFSLDVSAGCGGRHSTLLDEYERLAFEAQLNRAIVLRRCYSEPSPVRHSAEHQRPGPAAGGGRDARAPPLHRGPPNLLQGEGEAAARLDGPGGAGGGRFWRLHEVLARWIEALRPVFRWLRSAWECWTRQQQQQPDDAARRPPPTMPRVQLMDYLR